MEKVNRPIERFKEQLRDSLQREERHSNTEKILIERDDHVYSGGDTGESVYFIESGGIELLVSSPQGKDCLMAILSTGDVFGELCLSGASTRWESAQARERTTLIKIPRPTFYMILCRDELTEGFVRYLALRILDQQKLIAILVRGSSH